MPLSEFLRMARGKLESGQQKPVVSSRSEDDLVELVWENGQIVMQGQSSRATRSPTRNNLHPNTARVRDARLGKFGGVEPVLNDMGPVVPSGQLDLSQDDEMVPWLSYPMDDSLGDDYASEFLPEMSGVTGNGMSNRSSFLPVDRRNGFEQSVGNLPLGSGVSDIVSNNTCNNQDAMVGNQAQGRDVVSGSVDMKMERENIRPSTTKGSNFLNFSHFSRPANLVKANTDGNPACGSSAAERMEIGEKGPVRSTLERFHSTPKDVEFNGSSAGLPKVNSREPVVVYTPKGPTPPERKENLCLETSIKNDNSTKGAPDGERIVEPMVASSSVGSGNSADIVSCEQTHIDESDYRSDDVDTESLDVKKMNHVRGAKRGRAAEVHNLSERRRRDRINEKMRALQELIPNCNKADKASMLDEAIEYLKTLQLQVQIMSMGAGLCMPPMMFPTGMQHVHPAHVPHFPPMGVGVPAGMGFGMGMMDMNGVSSGYPVYPVTPMHVQHFRPHISGIPNFQTVPGPPVFGHPGQGLQNSVPRAPFVPLTEAPPVTSAMGTSASQNPGDPVRAMNSQSICNAEASCSINDKSNQAAGEVLDRAASVQDYKQGADATALTSDISKKPGEHKK